MKERFVSTEFDVPGEFEGPGFRLEPLGPQHNERDHDAWSSSIEHSRSTPGFGPDKDWPEPMSLDANRSDLAGHARDFERREGFTYSILEGDAVIGCVYIYPSTTPGHDADVSSWVRESRLEMDAIVHRSVTDWLNGPWPFENPRYAARVRFANPGS